MSAKTVSLISKIASGVILLGFFILKCIGIFHTNVDEVVKVAIAMSLIISGTIDINILADKVFKVEKKKNNESNND